MIVFAPFFLPLHHNVAIWEWFVVRQQLLVVLGHLCRCVVLHVIFDVLDAVVEHAESLWGIQALYAA